MPTAMESGPLLEVEHLCVTFSARKGSFGPRLALKAVDGVSLEVASGDVVGLVGESGSGKTTTARSILGLQKPDRGSVLFEGRDIQSLSGPDLRALRKRIQLIPQDAIGSLNPRRTVRQTISEGLQVHKLVPKESRQERVDELLADVGLAPEFADRYPEELSGGQIRRVCIARALSMGPSLIVADEPTAGLDVSVQAQILNLLQELRRRHQLSVLLISHDLSVVRYLCNKVAVMYFGRIVELGETRDLFSDPKHPYTRALLEAAPTVSAIGRGNELKGSIGGEVPALAAPPAGCSFHPRCNQFHQGCDEISPELFGLGGHRSVACLLYSDRSQ